MRPVVPGDPARGAHRRARRAGRAGRLRARPRHGLGGATGRGGGPPPSEFDRTTAGSCTRCRAHGRRSRARPSRRRSRPLGTFRVQHLRLALEEAVRGGRDTDTVAAIAGGLLGAAYGSTAVPAVVAPPPARLARAACAATSSRSPTRSRPTSRRSTATTPSPATCPRSVGTPTTTACGSAATRPCASRRPASTRSCRSAASAPTTCRTDVELIEVRLVDLPYPPRTRTSASSCATPSNLLRGAACGGQDRAAARPAREEPRARRGGGVRAADPRHVPSTLVIANVETVLLGARLNPYFRDAVEAFVPPEEKKPTTNSQHVRYRPHRPGYPRR